MLAAEALHLACVEARRYLGATSPNPPVGAAALDAQGNLIAVAAHQRAGEAHAEAALINRCRANGSLDHIHTLAVTLEPCNHHGRTPPCTAAILASPIQHILVGAKDPNPHVSGGGIEALRRAGRSVTLVDHAESQWLIHAFTHSVTKNIPWITIKSALDHNGSMIPPVGKKTFTSPASLQLAHRLRKKADAIVTGSGTILADAPHLTVRHVEDYPSKRRWLAILDRRHRVTTDYIDQATARGFDVLIYDDIKSCLHDLSSKHVRDVLVEAGPTLTTSLQAEWPWAMQITIKQGMPSPSPAMTDDIDVRFNESLSSSLPTADFNWDYILPTEHTKETA